MKRCKKCFQEKPEEEFYANRSHLNSYCKDCTKAISMVYKEKKKEERGADRVCRHDDCNNSLKGYRLYHTQCWDCFNKYNVQQAIIPAGKIYLAEYYNARTMEVVEGIYKIGLTSRDPQKRMAELGDTNGPMKVRLVTYWDVEEAETVEHKLHDQFKDYRIEGEWFEHDKLTLIQLINDTL